MNLRVLCLKFAIWPSLKGRHKRVLYVKAEHQIEKKLL